MQKTYKGKRIKYRKWYLKQVLPLLKQLETRDKSIKEGIEFVESLKDYETGEVYLLDDEREKLFDILTRNEKVKIKKL